MSMRYVFFPPPNITGLPHIGHFYNSLLQDTYIKISDSSSIEWIGGIDHAGIGAEYILNKNLQRENSSKKSLGYAKYIERMWSWKNEMSDKIISSVDKYELTPMTKWVSSIGGNIDYFIYKTFLYLYEDDLIYRDKRAVNCCFSCSTTLSDVEVAYVEKDGILYTLKYGDEKFSLPVSTTRPETIPGDVALAVHPEDARYREYIGRKVKVPATDRAIPIIADTSVDIGYGSGVLKITPAHSIADYNIAVRHSLGLIELFGQDGKVLQNSQFSGLDIGSLREKIIPSLQLISLKEIKHSVPICDKCKSPVETLASEQFFLRTAPLIAKTKSAIASEGLIYRPVATEQKLMSWFDNMHDWCISRQLWWGHKIPIDKDMNIVDFDTLSKKTDCDVLDTWFSSALWQFIAGGINKNGVPKQPIIRSEVLFTGYDILTFWVSKMLLMSPYIIERFSLAHESKLPIKEIALHGLLRDAKRKKMSKTAGNALSLDDLLKKSPMRDIKVSFLLATSVFGNDIKVEDRNFIFVRNFFTKLDNLLKFLVNNNENYKKNTSEKCSLLFNHYIFDKITKQKRYMLSMYKKMEYGKALYSAIQFIWHEFCDWYLELIKLRHIEGNRQIPIIAGELMDMISPFVSHFSRDDIIKMFDVSVSEIRYENTLICKCKVKCVNLVDKIKATISAIRTVTAVRSKNIHSEKVFFFSDGEQDELYEYKDIIGKLTGYTYKETDSGTDLYRFTVDGSSVSFPSVDRDALEDFVLKKIEKLQKLSLTYTKKLENANFLRRAPSEIVKETEEKVNSIGNEIAQLTILLKNE